LVSRHTASAGAKKRSSPPVFYTVSGLHFLERFMGWFRPAGSNRPAFMAIESLATNAILTGSRRKSL
jgi:hypothetical protein